MKYPTFDWMCPHLDHVNGCIQIVSKLCFSLESLKEKSLVGVVLLRRRHRCPQRHWWGVRRHAFYRWWWVPHQNNYVMQVHSHRPHAGRNLFAKPSAPDRILASCETNMWVMRMSVSVNSHHYSPYISKICTQSSEISFGVLVVAQLVIASCAASGLVVSRPDHQQAEFAAALVKGVHTDSSQRTPWAAREEDQPRPNSKKPLNLRKQHPWWWFIEWCNTINSDNLRPGFDMRNICGVAECGSRSVFDILLRIKLGREIHIIIDRQVWWSLAAASDLVGDCNFGRRGRCQSRPPWQVVRDTTAQTVCREGWVLFPGSCCIPGSHTRRWHGLPRFAWIQVQYCTSCKEDPQRMAMVVTRITWVLPAWRGQTCGCRSPMLKASTRWCYTVCLAMPSREGCWPSWAPRAPGSPPCWTPWREGCRPSQSWKAMCSWMERRSTSPTAWR